MARYSINAKTIDFVFFAVVQHSVFIQLLALVGAYIVVGNKQNREENVVHVVMVIVPLISIFSWPSSVEYIFNMNEEINKEISSDNR